LIQTFHCPNCGAPLDPPEGSFLSIRCSFCSSTIIVPKELNRQPTLATPTKTYKPISSLKIDPAKGLIEIIQLVKSGQRQKAIFLFREIFDSNRGIAEAAINRIEQGEIVEIDHLLEPGSDLSQLKTVTLETPPDSSKKINFLSHGLTYIPFVFIGFLFLVVGIPIFLSAIQAGGFLYEFWMKNNPISETPLIFSFGGDKAESVLLSEPGFITADQDGNIYVAEFTGGKIQQFDKNGGYIRGYIAGEGKVIIRALEVDLNGILYAAIGQSILRFDTKSGNLLEPLSNPEDYFYHDIKLLPDGSLIAMVDGDNLVRLNKDGSTIWLVEDAISTIAGETDTRGLLAVDEKSNIYISGTFIESVFVYSNEGKYLNRIGSEGDDDGQFSSLSAITVDGLGRVLVNDWGKLEFFQPDGRWLKQIQLPYQTRSVDIGPDGLLYVVTNEPKVYIMMVK